MSERNGRFTRRQIMAGAAAGTVAAMAARANATHHIPNKDCAVMPAAQLDALGTLANNDYGVDKKRFEDISEILWCYFVLGVVRAGEGRIIIDPADDLPMAAYLKGSGEAIAKNMATTRYPADNEHPTTNFCAYHCGENAAELADLLGHNKIAPDTLRSAWDKTKRDIGPLLARLNAIREASGGDPGAPTIGLGCT